MTIKHLHLHVSQILNVKQGYSKCSVCPVTETAFITDDEGIAFAGKTAGFDVLKVKKGSVSLSGYEYGFIGGCCGMVDADKLLFCGNAKLHDNYEDIKSFVNNYKIEIISLNGNQPTDIGSFFAVTESEE